MSSACLCTYLGRLCSPDSKHAMLLMVMTMIMMMLSVRMVLTSISVDMVW